MAEPSADEVTIYTDGACRGNPGPGGWGAYLVARGVERDLWGGEAATTNNRMELTAVIMALRALTQPCAVAVHTDSKYVIDGITGWVFGWQRNGWINAAKKPVANADLWRDLLDAVRPHKIAWNWVKGHAGHAQNERADELAREGLIAARAGAKGAMSK